MRSFWLLFLGAGFAANGLFMLLAPLAWYGVVPGVTETGPFNPHFVRDIGCAYLVAGASLAWLVRDPRAWPAAIAGGAFLALHALIHVADALGGHVHGPVLASDVALVVLPALLVLALSWPRAAARHS